MEQKLSPKESKKEYEGEKPRRREKDNQKIQTNKHTKYKWAN